MTIVTEIDWKCFCEEWGGIEEKGISAEIELSNIGGSTLPGSSVEKPVSEEEMGSLDELNNEFESKQLRIRTCPEVSRAFCVCLKACIQ